MNRNAYTTDAETFLSELNEEYYRHGAGLKGELELSPIYRRYEYLFTPRAVRALLADKQTREGRHLAHFGVFGFVENELRELTEQIADMEARATVVWEGEAVPYRKARVLAVSEADTNRRRELERRIVAATDKLNPQSALRLARAHAVAVDLGFDDYAALSDELAGLRLAELSEQMQRLLAETEPAYDALLGEHLAAAGVAPEEATAGDFGFVRRGPQFDPAFGREKLLPALTETFAGLGLALEAQTNVTLDVEERPLKSPRAFCAPVRVPADVRLVTRPRGGHDDYLALFHEAGHMEHFACTDARAPFDCRCLGDNSVTEAYAFLIGKLPTLRPWLREVLGLEDAAGYPRLARLVDLHYLRRYASKLSYELELHCSETPEGMDVRYAEVLQKALKLRAWRENYLYDVDDFFYAACYLRAWMLEVQLRRRLVGEFGERWFRRREAGRYLMDLWSVGQELNAEEVAGRLGYSGLQVEPLIEDLVSLG